MRPLAFLALVIGSLLGAWPAPARAEGPVARTLVLRGVVTEADGKPISGARVSVRGSAVLSTFSGANGRYALDVVMGTGAGLARGPFRVDVRAELGGKRLGLVGGGSALVAEVVLLPGSPARADVRSNSELAVAAIATSFAQESITHAWVQADFGAGASGGSNELRYRDSVPLPGAVAAPAGRPVRPAPAAIDAGARARDSVTAAKARERARRDANLAIARSAQRVRADSLARARAQSRRADSLAWVASRDAQKPKPAVRRAPVAKARAAVRDTTQPRVVVSPPDTARAAQVAATTAPGAPPAARVLRIEPFGEAALATPTDTCACRLRGTVEVKWPRPLEEGLPIRLTLDGPATQRTEVTLDMGAPREFRLGPLPCGEYRLTVKPLGRLRYALSRGGDTMTVLCEGPSEVRVVLTPVRK